MFIEAMLPKPGLPKLGLRRTIAGLLALLAAVLAPAGRSWSQTQGSPTQGVATPTPAVANGQSAKPEPQPATETPLQPAPVPLAVPKAAPPAPEKAAPVPKVGPGANDAGNAATSLRTTKLSLISLVDRSVTGSGNREIGHVVDVLLDAKGQPAALVVDVGGFMGMGNRRIAIAWERFALAGRKPSDALQLPFSDAQIKAAPAFDGSEEVTVVQGAVQPPSANAELDASRVDLGEGLGAASDPYMKDPAPQADPLNPD